jgi:hypothetical protein
MQIKRHMPDRNLKCMLIGSHKKIQIFVVIARYDSYVTGY